MRMVIVFLSLAALALWGRQVRAEDMRCGVNLVSIGDSESVVREKCGEPTHVARKSYRYRRALVTWDQWTFDLGPTAFVRILTFDADADHLMSITVGDYGH